MNICVISILMITLNFKMCIQLANEELKDVPMDFKIFLEGLGSTVYKYKKATRAGAGAVGNRQRHDEYSNTSVTMPTKILTRNEGSFQQKATLRDVLMMKLISYYENKYKITDRSSATDISLQRKNSNDADALNEMKRTENTRNNLKSTDALMAEEVLVA